MEFTGERLIPHEQRQDDLYHEHLVRYMFASQFAAGRRVLDAGCGAGYGAALLADSAAAAVLGVDLAPDAVAYASAHYQRPGLSFAVQDLAAPDLPPAGYDLIVSFEVIEHLDDPGALVRAAGRLLAAGGLFIVSTPNIATYPPGNPFHKHEMGVAQFTSLLEEAFPAYMLYAQDYATALSLRPLAFAAGDLPTAWHFTPAAGKLPLEPDYFVAICAREQDTLVQALQQARSIMYELPADRLGERIRDALTLQAALDEANRVLADKDAYIAGLEQEQQRQGAWAAGLEQQLLDLKKAWYVRLFGRR